MTELQTLLDVIPIGIAIAEDPPAASSASIPSFRPAAAACARRPTLPSSAPPGERPTITVFQNGQELPAGELPMQQAAARVSRSATWKSTSCSPDGTTVNLFGYAAPLLDEHGRPRLRRRLPGHHRAQACPGATLQTERLAAIGQMMTGLAHESGNALARSQACLEMLAWRWRTGPKPWT